MSWIQEGCKQEAHQKEEAACQGSGSDRGGARLGPGGHERHHQQEAGLPRCGQRFKTIKMKYLIFD